MQEMGILEHLLAQKYDVIEPSWHAWHAVVNFHGNCMQAALGAGMRCIITYTSSTKDQDFEGAERIMEGLADNASLAVLSQGGPVFDDRVAAVVAK